MYKVNENCIGCGTCVGICPDVFQFNDEGFAENIIGDIPSELEKETKEAAECCPVNAIVNE